MNGENLNQPNNSEMQSTNNLNQSNNHEMQQTPAQPSNNNYQNNGNNGSKNNNIIYIIIGVVALVVVALVLYFTVFEKDKGYEGYNDYDDYLKNEEKIKEKINKNFSINDYKIQDGILVELKNDNNIPVDSNIKIEFYDANGSVVNVEDGYMFNVPAKGKSYEKVYVDEEIKYATYKVTAKLQESYIEKTYNDKIEIVSNTKQNDSLIIQVKNNADVKLSGVGLGLIYIGSNNTIIEYDYIYIEDLAAGETVSEKTYIPYDYNTFKTINYEKVDIVVVSAVNTK